MKNGVVITCPIPLWTPWSENFRKVVGQSFWEFPESPRKKVRKGCWEIRAWSQKVFGDFRKALGKSSQRLLGNWGVVSESFREFPESHRKKFAKAVGKLGRGPCHSIVHETGSDVIIASYPGPHVLYDVEAWSPKVLTIKHFRDAILRTYMKSGSGL